MTTTDPIDLDAIRAQLDDPYNCMHPNSRRDLEALYAEVERLTGELAEARAALESALRAGPVITAVAAWRHHNPGTFRASERLAAAWDAYTAGQPGADSDAWVLPEGVTTYRTWWLRVHGGTYRMASLQAALDARAKGFIAGAAPGEGEVLYCDEFRPARTPFRVWTGDADEAAQDAPRGTAGPDVGKETPDAPRGAEAARRRRLRECVESWPDARTCDYDPRCCRFPKSCSADIYDDETVREEDLEDTDGR